MKNEERVKHIELIQGVINRLANNSFLIKGWMITVVMAGIGISVSQSMKALYIVTIVAIVLFWFLDAYYLRLEKLFRKHFDFVANAEDDLKFDMDFSKYQKDTKTILRIMFSSPTIILYLPILILTIVLGGCIK